MFRVHLQGAHARRDEENGEHWCEIHRVPGKDECTFKLNEERRRACELQSSFCQRHEEVHREESCGKDDSAHHRRAHWRGGAAPYLLWTLHHEDTDDDDCEAAVESKHDYVA